MSKTIYITSGKGGTGKSTFAANIGLTLAYMGKRVILLDMNMGMRDLDLYLGVQNEAIFDVYDVIMRTCEPRDAIIHSNFVDKLAIIPAHQGGNWIDISRADIDELIEHLKGEYDIVIMDGAPGINRAVDLCHSSADEVIIVTTPDYSAIRDADAIEDRLIKNEIMNRHYVLNRVMPVSDDLGCGPSLVEIDLRFRSQLLGVIMEDENIRASCNIGIPIVAKRDTYIARNFDKIAERMIREIL
ncbi:AAA family ATPase [Mogibacterium diversum]|uniref:AAA family ATPase n=1 Tax=Mogibacterium diversum TaxID=114527 RepID=UPI0026ED74B5|nr:AAA family ATPase [Mogibacterium diversum]